ncbi:uncharacterized protein [Phaseolus vulgaris]|uniref:uncharacterized protein n=1 Tax=Phaseolus vulgaris TaxID=3885 RepID=UPI0035C9F119
MRNTRQGPLGSEGSDNHAIQQLKTVTTLQEAVAASRADQERLMAEVRAEKVLRQYEFMVELDASRASNEELPKANEELRKDLQQLGERSIGERGPTIQTRARLKPFSQAILDAVTLASFITPKIVFTGTEDLEAHFTTFNAQMMILGGTNTMHCKMFMGTFTGTTLRWFVGLLDDHITSFDQFSELFREQFILNQAQPPVSFDLFSEKQRQGEPLKDLLTRFGAFVVKLQTRDEALMVHAFGQGIKLGPFSDSVIKNRARTFEEIRRRVVAHIAAEEIVTLKRCSIYPG